MRIRFVALTALMLMLFTACSAPQARTGGERTYTFTDDLGTAVSLEPAPKTVVALMGSYAETWLNAGGKLAGVTDDVISERGLTVGEDTRIVGTVKHPNLEEILALAPELVLLSADIASHRAAAETLESAGVPCAFFQVEHFEDYLRMLKVCTDLTGEQERYSQYGTAIAQSIQDIKLRVPGGVGPKVLMIRALSTKAKAIPMEHMAAQMLRELGADNIAAGLPSLLEDLSMEEIIREDPDWILVVPMGDVSKAAEALKAGVEAHPAWKNLSAVKNGRYVLLPKELFQYKPNARWGESYEYLAELLYPETFGA